MIAAVPAFAAAPPASALLNLPLSFEPNRGQADPSVRFLSRGVLAGPAYTLELTADSALFEVPGPEAKHPAAIVRMRLAGAQLPRISAREPLPGKVSYFLGNDPARWVAGAATYARVDYQRIYPGIDLTFYGTQRQIEYDFLVAAGADPARIALDFEGARPTLSADGALRLRLHGATLSLRQPVSYQTVDGQKQLVACRYILNHGQVRFALGPYDRTRPLVIDPVLDYLTYLGGAGGGAYIGAPQTACAQCSQQNPAQGVAVDQAGNLYVTGYTTSTRFPVQNPIQFNVTGNANLGVVFVTEINPTASAIVYSTYLGGSTYDRASAIAVDSSGAAYIAGQAWSADFPVTKGAFQTLCAPGPGANNALTGGCATASNAFLTKLAPGGSNLVYSTFLGGSHYAAANALAIDAQGRAYIAGTTDDQCDAAHSYRCFPETTNALLPSSLYNGTVNPQTRNAGAAFVAVFDAAGANLLYSTLYGDSNPSNPSTNSQPTIGTGVAVDPSGSFYLTGFTANPEIPTTSGAFQTTGTNNQSNGGIAYRGFVAKFPPVTGAGPSLVYGTYLGGKATNETNGEQVSGIAVDAAGNAYITGLTQSYDFPVTAGANSTIECGPASYACQSIGFLSKLNPSGSALVWSTLVGVSSKVIGGSLNSIGVPRLDADGNVYVTGQGTYTYPVVNPVQPASQDSNGGVFVTRYDPTGSNITFSTVFYSPAGAPVFAGGMDVDSQGNIFAAGYTGATDLPVTAGVFQPACTTCSRSGFLARIHKPGPAPVIASVVNGASFQPAIESGSWVTITGTNLSNTNPGRTWTASEIVNGNLPTSLDNTSVTIDGKPAYVYYISPTQLNVLAPADTNTGTVNVVVTNNSQVSTPFSAQLAAYAPAFFLYSGTSYAIVSHHPDYAPVANPAAVPGTIAAHPGDILILWGTGFGPTNPPTAAGVQVTGAPPVATLPTVTVGGVPVTVIGAALSSGSAGLYQIAIQLPQSIPTGVVAVQAAIGQTASAAGTTIFIAQ